MDLFDGVVCRSYKLTDLRRLTFANTEWFTGVGLFSVSLHLSRISLFTDRHHRKLVDTVTTLPFGHDFFSQSEEDVLGDQVLFDYLSVVGVSTGGGYQFSFVYTSCSSMVVDMTEI